jgi:hypothetical protein
MKTQEEDMHTERGSNQTKKAATDRVMEPELDQEAIGLLAYFY